MRCVIMGVVYHVPFLLFYGVWGKKFIEVRIAVFIIYPSFR